MDMEKSAARTSLINYEYSIVLLVERWVLLVLLYYYYYL
jgi:hypothetical protein